MGEAIILKGTPLAKQVKEQVSFVVAGLIERGIEPTMSVVLASNDPSALSYAQSKQRVAASLGIKLNLIELGPFASQRELESTLAALSDDPCVHGILLEFPLAADLDSDKALAKISPVKDVDGLTTTNLGLVLAGGESQAITSATAQACIELAETQGSLAGKNVGLVGRGRTVGRPLIGMLVNRHATLTICHTRTRNLARALAHCDVVIVATGRPGTVGGEHLVSGQVVIDAGINVVDDKMLGDVDAEAVLPKVAALTPVPGGVGPLTSAIIFRNLLKAISLQYPEENL